MRVQNLYLVLLTVSLISVPGVVCGQDRENQEDRDKRRQFDHESYLNRIDDNKNGILEVSEMSERTKVLFGFVLVRQTSISQCLLISN